MTKYIFLFLLVSMIAVLQSSVFALFPLWGLVPNYLIIFVILYLLLEKERSSEGVFVAGFSGLWFDVFASTPFGVYTLCFLVGAYVLKLTFNRYVGVSIVS